MGENWKWMSQRVDQDILCFSVRIQKVGSGNQGTPRLASAQGTVSREEKNNCENMLSVSGDILTEKGKLFKSQIAVH